ncbi:unnamed protein product, partial [Meganyctiphanes norvegica]
MPADAKSFNELGPRILHEYTIFNPEQYEIYTTECIFSWPIKIKGQYWNYLTRAPTFTGVQSSQCEISGGEIDEFKIAEISGAQMLKDNSIEPEITFNPSSSSVIHSTRGKKTKSLDTWNEDIKWMTLTCKLGPLPSRGTAIITIKSHLVEATLTSLKLGIGIQEMWSTATCQATKLPLNAPPSGKLSEKTTETTIAYNYETPDSPS